MMNPDTVFGLLMLAALTLVVAVGFLVGAAVVFAVFSGDEYDVDALDEWEAQHVAAPKSRR